MCLKSHWISRNKNYFDGRMNNWYIFGPSSIFFFPDCRTLKFLKMKCNPTNKKMWPKYYCIGLCACFTNMNVEVKTRL